MNTDLNKLKEHLTCIKHSLDADIVMLDKNISALSSIVQRFYSKESPYQERVIFFTKAISQMKMMKRNNNPLYGFSTESIKNDMSFLIDNIIQEIERIGLPDNDVKIDKSITITNNLTQSQILEFNFIIDVIKDELNGKQMKEISTIINGTDEPVVKKEKIIDKLKSFGENVLAGIVAGIITNPAILTQI